MMIIRPPIVAGSFYELGKDVLKKQIEGCFKHKLGPKGTKTQKILAAVVPHAGYDYSGPVAAWVYSVLEPANYIILGPNHAGIGSDFAISKKGLWKTPLGDVAIDQDVAEKLSESCKLIEYDILAHEREHSIEVQLPFLQYKFGSDFKFVPICIRNEFADQMFLDSCKVVGKVIANLIKKRKEKWVVLASSDFSHYIPQEIARETDRSLIKSIEKLNENEFYSKLSLKNATVCGYGPIIVGMVAAKELGAKKGKLLKYATSGDITEEFNSVVGYASIILH